MQNYFKAWFVIGALTISSFALAMDTSSFRTSNGQLVNVGDTWIQAQNALKIAPVASSSELVTEGEKTFELKYYTYQVDGILYTIKVKNNKIESIDWVKAS